ncbi:MAG: FHA domain-containing protein, partial [Polyangiaceae bacterium]
MPHVPFSDDDMALPTVATQRAEPRTAQALRITVLAGQDAGHAVTVAQQRVLIGRAGTADLRLADATVSSFHAEVGAEGGGVSVRDLESRNGTWFQGARIGQALLPSGAMLQVGAATVRLDLDATFELTAPALAELGELRGASARSRELFGLLARLARTELAVLLEGPTGVGTELAARAVHEHSAHAGGPFAVLDCTSIPASL